MSTVSVSIPSFLTKFNKQFFYRIIIEVVQSTAIAGAVGGLTVLGNDVPVISDHFGLSPLVTAQLTAVILYGRTFVSGLNSVKQTAATPTHNA
jgi:hypothetical protein